MKFAKIIECQGEQVLFFLEPDEEADEREMLHQVVRIDGMCIDVKVGGLTYDKADKVFADLNEDSAELVLKAVRDMIGAAA